MHFIQAKGILSAQNGMNLFRGCTHGCIYCDSRSNCYQMDHRFEDIAVKENAIALLSDRLARKRTKCMIGMGAMTDPYLPEERQLQYTRQALQVIQHYGFGATLITKSADVLRDLDLLQAIHRQSKCVIQITLTTFDETLCKKLEPNVSSTQERFQALKVLRDAGIPTVVWLTPILPFINDTKENLLGILDYCRQAQVYGIINFGMGVTLRDGNREYFYQQLDRHFPGLKQRYIQTYGNRYILNSKNNNQLMTLFQTYCQTYHIENNNHKIFTYLNSFEDKTQPIQLSLF